MTSRLMHLNNVGYGVMAVTVFEMLKR